MSGKRDKRDWTAAQLSGLQQAFMDMSMEIRRTVERMNSLGFPVISVGMQKSLTEGLARVQTFRNELQKEIDRLEIQVATGVIVRGTSSPQPELTSSEVDELTLRAREKLREAQAIQQQRPAIDPGDWAEEQSRKLGRSKSAPGQKDKQDKKKTGGG